MDYIDFAAMGAAAFIFLSYGVYWFYTSKSQQYWQSKDWIKRIKGTSTASALASEKELSLLKSSPDDYFKSKVPRTFTLENWIQQSGINISPLLFFCTSFFIGVFFCFFSF